MVASYVQLNTPIKGWARIISQSRALTKAIVLVGTTPILIEGASRSILWDPKDDSSIPVKEQSIIDAFGDYLEFKGGRH